MPSFSTICRAVVMVAVGAVGVKGWHLYGPTNEQVKSAAVHVIELAQTAIQSRQESPAGGTASDPRVAAPPETAPPVGSVSQTEAPRLLPEAARTAGVSSSQAPITPLAERPLASPESSGGRMPELMARLEQLGAAESNLAAWGSGGNLFRFSCRAPLANTPAFTQHFESVASEPVVAVEQVLAKVEAWRLAQRDSNQLR